MAAGGPRTEVQASEPLAGPGSGGTAIVMCVLTMAEGSFTRPCRRAACQAPSWGPSEDGPSPCPLPRCGQSGHRRPDHRAEWEHRSQASQIGICSELATLP